MILDVVNPFSGFEYRYFIYAFIALILLSLILPILGIRLASKGYSMIADTLSHTSLAGIAIGIISGGLPILYAIIMSVIGAIILEIIRIKLPKYSSIGLTIILALSLGIVGIISGFVNSNFDKYLFGSLLTISNSDLIILSIIVGIALIYEVLFKRSNMKIAYNEIEAKALGIKVNLLSLLDCVIISIAVAISCKIIGSLLVTSFISIPVVFALKSAKSSRSADFFAIFFSLITSIIGLFIGYSFNLHIGGIIVLFAILVLFISFIFDIVKSKKKKLK